MKENYPSASEMVRNLAQIRIAYETIAAEGDFRIIRFSPPFWDGCEYWIVNSKGFLWEPAADLSEAEAYLRSEEALAESARAQDAKG